MNISIQITGLHFQNLTREQHDIIVASGHNSLQIEDYGTHTLVTGSKQYLYDLLWYLSTIYDLTLI